MAQRKSPEHGTSTKDDDAFTLLTEDHKKVRKLFTDFRKVGAGKEAGAHKQELVEQICMELTIHAKIEEEIFYPAVRAAVDDEELMDEADEEHAEIKEVVAQLESSTPKDSQYDDRVSTLAETVSHHVKEEEGEIFAKARKAKLDTAALGTRMKQRKAELQTELATVSHGSHKKGGKSHTAHP